MTGPKKDKEKYKDKDGMGCDQPEEDKIESNMRFRRGRSLPGADPGGAVAAQ